MRHRRRTAAAAVVAVVVACALAGPASAATIPVTTDADSLAADGACSLREAVIAANTDAPRSGCPAGIGVDTIELPAGTYVRSIAGFGEGGAEAGDLDLTANVTIHGAGAPVTTVDAARKDRVFHTAPGRVVTIEGVTVTGGGAPAGANGGNGFPTASNGAEGAGGGGILNQGALTLVACRVSDNLAGTGGNGGAAAPPEIVNDGTDTNGGNGGPGGGGGGIYSSGTLTLVDSTVAGNHSGRGGNGGAAVGTKDTGVGTTSGSGTGGDGGNGGNGGGIFSSGDLTATRSTVSQNVAGASGAGGAGVGAEGGDYVGPGEGGGTGGGGTGGAGGIGGNGGGMYVTTNFSLTASTVSLNVAGGGGGGGNGTGGNGGSASSGNTGNGGSGGAGTAGGGGFGGSGGGVLHVSSLAATNLTVSGNSAGSGGPGGNSQGGTGTTASPGGSGNGGTGGAGFGGPGGGAGEGGGLFSFGLALSQSTVTGNAAGLGGERTTGQNGAGGPGTGTGTHGAPGPASKGAAPITAQTGGVELRVGQATITSTIVASNTPSNCKGAIGDGGYNIDFPDSSCPGAAGDPLLAPLADNGGPTATHALQPGGAAADIVPVGAACEATDQRGLPRPFGAACDAGAYELTPPGATTEAADGATMKGSVTPNLRATLYHFEYGPTTAYGSATPDADAGAGGAAIGVSASIPDPAPGTTHYRLVAASADGTTAGADMTLTAQDRVAPALSAVTITRSVFAVGAAPTAVSAGARRTPRGTKFRYTLSEAATVTITIGRARKGRRKGRRCVKPTRKLRRAKRCTRYVRAGRLTRAGRAGPNEVPFSGRIGKRKLRPGRYRAVLRATDPAGNKSRSQTVKFRIARR